MKDMMKFLLWCMKQGAASKPVRKRKVSGTVNSRVIEGRQFLATLDGRTCPLCAMLDGMIWQRGQYSGMPKPPMHKECRCVILPWFSDDEPTGTRPAANADFMKLAEESYYGKMKGKRTGKQWPDLSESTRKKYYYQAMKDYETRTGNPAYRQVNETTTFAQYFDSQDENFKHSWLGENLYAMYLRGEITVNGRPRGPIDLPKVVQILGLKKTR